MKIIVINGQGGAGKDTFIDFCRKKTWDIHVHSFSTVHFVKEIAKQCGWKGEKTQESRRFLSDLKDAMTRYNDRPFYSVLEAIDHLLYELHCYDISTKDLVIFIHSREPSDIKRWVETLNARTLLIHKSSDNIFNNHADRDVYTIDYDYVVVNNGTLEELKEKALNFIDSVREEDWKSVDYEDIFKIVQEWRFKKDDKND